MTESERKIKRRVQMVVATSMVVFSVMMIVLVVQLSIIGNQKRMEKSLRLKQQELAYNLEHERDKIDYYTTQKFADEYALNEFGIGQEGTKIFK